MRGPTTDRIALVCLFTAAAIAIAVGAQQDAIVIMLYVIAGLLERIERHLSRRAGARGESDG